MRRRLIHLRQIDRQISFNFSHPASVKVLKRHSVSLHREMLPLKKLSVSNIILKLFLALDIIHWTYL